MKGCVLIVCDVKYLISIDDIYFYILNFRTGLEEFFNGLALV